ncbi:plasma kallikrein [Clonorchis sinensis]|uniref:Plasma kallikrein n=1 Tax=Clonorchis sinensis TaxID=79923 RepID=G7YKH3_CLOSI|nr:plasma kallikrein [Clonorchis sinensis]
MSSSVVESLTAPRVKIGKYRLSGSEHDDTIVVRVWGHFPIWWVIDKCRPAPPVSEHQFSMSKRIIGGEPVEADKYLWAVSLQVDENTGPLARFKINYLPLCGGSLISSRWVVTASHCFYYTQDPSRWRVRLGYGKLHAGYWETAKSWFYHRYGSQRQMLKPYYNVKEIFIHPEFHPQGMYKDIALVYLKESVPFKVLPGFAPLRLPKHTPTGEWPPPGSGDSGGPLVCYSVDGKEILAGVAISGNPNGPSIFTGASHFRTWIDSMLRYHHTLD